MDTEEKREYWNGISETAEKVRAWPEWKRNIRFGAW